MVRIPRQRERIIYNTGMVLRLGYVSTSNVGLGMVYESGGQQNLHTRTHRYYSFFRFSLTDPPIFHYFVPSCIQC